MDALFSRFCFYLLRPSFVIVHSVPTSYQHQNTYVKEPAVRIESKIIRTIKNIELHLIILECGYLFVDVQTKGP